MSDHDVFAEEVPATKLVMVKKVKMRGIYELDNHMKDLLKSRIQKVRDQASDISDTPRMPGPAASATNVGAGSPRGTSSPRAGGSAGGARQRKGASSGAVGTTREGGNSSGGMWRSNMDNSTGLGPVLMILLLYIACVIMVYILG